MTLEDELAKGDKIQTSIYLYPAELATIDGICLRFDCSRSSVIAAWVKEYAEMDLTDKVKPGRRAGAGRPRLRKKRTRR
ncbi:MAG: hypothetical protein WC829_06975 [Hyphomicrobium sp.]|jgi:hypothetical protein